jgi:hypothetical protein
LYRFGELAQLNVDGKYTGGEWKISSPVLKAMLATRDREEENDQGEADERIAQRITDGPPPAETLSFSLGAGHLTPPSSRG